MKQILQQYLSNAENYEHATENAALDFVNKTVETFMTFVKEKGNNLSNKDMTCLERGINQHKRIPVFCSMPKAYKQKIPIPLQPVVATIGSPYHCVSRWVDSYLRELLPYVSSHIKDSDDLLGELKKFGPIEGDAFMSTSDAVAMCLNIRTDEGIMFLIAALDACLFKARLDWPRKQLLKAIELMLKFNVFRFENLHFRQKEGAAMGSLFACLSAIFMFAMVEQTILLPRFKHSILLLVQFIDGTLILWRRTSKDNREWIEFTKTLNRASKLDWIAENFVKESPF